jgi:hypothetical protein
MADFFMNSDILNSLRLLRYAEEHVLLSLMLTMRCRINEPRTGHLYSECPPYCRADTEFRDEFYSNEMNDDSITTTSVTESLASSNLEQTHVISAYQSCYKSRRWSEPSPKLNHCTPGY